MDGAGQEGWSGNRIRRSGSVVPDHSQTSFVRNYFFLAAFFFAFLATFFLATFFFAGFLTIFLLSSLVC